MAASSHPNLLSNDYSPGTRRSWKVRRRLSLLFLGLTGHSGILYCRIGHSLRNCRGMLVVAEILSGLYGCILISFINSCGLLVNCNVREIIFNFKI